MLNDMKKRCFLFVLIGLLMTALLTIQPAGVLAANQRFSSSGSSIAWKEGYLISGASASVSALLEVDDVIYAGGSFTYMDGVRVNKIAMWDTASPGWAPLGQGVTEGNAFSYSVSDIAADGLGNIYIVGSFNKVDGITVNNVAKWNGTSWEALGNGLPGGQAHAVTVDADNNVYVGGLFNTAGRVSVSNIARWNATSSSWETLGDGLDNRVFTLFYDSTNDLIYAGGMFTGTDNPIPIELNHIGRWDETSGWVGISISGNIGTDGDVYALGVYVSGNYLMVGGNFSTFLGTAANNCAVLALGFVSPICDTNGSVNSLAYDTDNGDYIIGGNFSQIEGISANNIALIKSDLSAHKYDAGTNSSVSALIFDADSDILTVGGYFTSAGTSPGGQLPENYIAQWDTTGGSGDQWSAMTTLSFGDTAGINGTVYDIAFDSFGRATIVGRFSAVAGSPYNNIYDGMGAVSEGGGTDGTVYTAAHMDTLDTIIGGSFTEVEGISAENLAYWDESTDTWAPIGGVSPDGQIKVVYVDGTDVYVGGDFTQIGAGFYNHIAKWDSLTNTWSALGDGLNDTVEDIIKVNGVLYATGRFTASDSISVSRLAAWDGVSWSEVGGVGLNAAGASLAADSAGNLYVGGSFSQVGTASIAHLAKWDGSAWSALASGFSGTVITDVKTLAFDAQDNLIVSGAFKSVDGVAAEFIAFNDGSSWHAIDTGLSDAANTIAFDSMGTMYVGGSFDRAGQFPASHIARVHYPTFMPLSMR